MRQWWIKELARDLIALGSIPFLLLTIARVSMFSVYYPMQFIISGTLFFILRMIFRAEYHAGLGFILFTFISLYYQSVIFCVFAFVVYMGMVLALFYLKKDKRVILNGIVLGLICTALGYFIVSVLFSKG